jgi:hypothetical protein
VKLGAGWNWLTNSVDPLNQIVSSMEAPQKAGLFTMAKYPLKLFLRVINVSLEPMKIVVAWPKMKLPC